jgi:hypothetical protein
VVTLTVPQVLAIVNGDRIPWDAYEPSDDDTDSEFSDDDDDDSQGSTELQQLFASIESIVKSLFRLSYVFNHFPQTSC